MRSELYFGSSDADVNRLAFDRLLQARERFEEVYGRALDWQPLEGKKACRITDDRPGSPVDSIDEWENYITWLFDAGSRMRRAVHALGGIGG